jgi:hypothetical protein
VNRAIAAGEFGDWWTAGDRTPDLCIANAKSTYLAIDSPAPPYHSARAFQA